MPWLRVGWGLDLNARPADSTVHILSKRVSAEWRWSPLGVIDSLTELTVKRREAGRQRRPRSNLTFLCWSQWLGRHCQRLGGLIGKLSTRFVALLHCGCCFHFFFSQHVSNFFLLLCSLWMVDLFGWSRSSF